MPSDQLARFDKTVARIQRQQLFGVSCYAFLSGIADNSERNAKFTNSLAGHALDLCIRSVQTSLILYCDRHWDSREDCQSIPTARTYACQALDEIISRHQTFFDAGGYARDAAEFCEYFQKLDSDISKAEASSARRKIRVLRTEYYAHLTENSSDRKNARRADPLFRTDDLTLSNLLEFAKQTIQIGNRLQYLKCRASMNFDSQIAHMSTYYDNFWDNLPNFSEIEGTQ